MASLPSISDPSASVDAPIRPASAEPVVHVDLAEFSKDILGGIRDLHARFGPIAAIQSGLLRLVFLFSPEYNQQVLSDQQNYHARFFTIRGPRESSQRRLTCGLLAMNGEQHRRNRRLVKQPFSLKSIAGYGAVVRQLTEEMLADWRPGEVRDMAEEMRRLLLRVTSTLLFGLDDTERAFRLGDHVADWVAMNHRLGVGALVPDAIFTDGYEELLKFAGELEEEILALIRMRRKAGSLGDDVLSILVRTHDEEGGLSDEELVGQAAVLFGAAHMTTSHAMTWTLLLAAQHPSVMSRLWQELQNGPAPTEAAAAHCPHASDPGRAGQARPAGANDQGGDAWSAATGKGGEDSLLDRVIRESMRILPASAYSQRFNTAAVDIGPLHLPRGTGIVFTPIVTHRLTSIYADPERFDPDRWLTLRPTPYEYIPFGGGSRLCIGGPLAMAILRTALPLILRRFRLTVAAGAVIDARIEGTMLVPVNGVPMRIDAADGRFESAPISGSVCELVRFDEILR